jgi:hypothetical protein
MSRRERAALYREAARSVAQDEVPCACWAVEDAAGDLSSEERVAFMGAFKPRNSEGRGFRAGFWLERESESAKDSQHRRVVALCLAAAMARTGDL